MGMRKEAVDIDCRQKRGTGVSTAPIRDTTAKDAEAFYHEGLTFVGNWTGGSAPCDITNNEMRRALYNWAVRQ